MPKIFPYTVYHKKRKVSTKIKKIYVFLLKKVRLFSFSALKKDGQTPALLEKELKVCVNKLRINFEEGILREQQIERFQFVVPINLQSQGIPLSHAEEDGSEDLLICDHVFRAV